MKILVPRMQRVIYAETSILPLVLLRIVFGLLMFVGTLRFMRNGWIDSAQLERLAAPMLKNNYGQYLLKILRERARK